MAKEARYRSKTVEGLEELILGSIYKHQGMAYGVTVWDDLRQAGREVAIGQIYATIDRLEASGFVESEFGEATKERGGRRKKFFAITGEGVQALNEAESIRRRIIPLNALLGVN